jgi:hypothetical protein
LSQPAWAAPLLELNIQDLALGEVVAPFEPPEKSSFDHPDRDESQVAGG